MAITVKLLHYNVLLGTRKNSTLYPRYVVTKKNCNHKRTHFIVFYYQSN